ncbi:hypothetical protein CROQUDRAFT_653203 [Cronartium quercuum f. sp. fusiforme G11]|uniref:SCP domain-containing protein n=1 Tax=Cronartium quercuum f. sp. fusiforme G11 TaxID=708437 RepID=A0A9P6NPY0_9BASI|nr:hypothetical protein CROQUDRAFT_653203 [Cronartium quercuum f. sp. fusiforme G11]
MALWMSALFGPPMDADGNPCPTSSEQPITQESQVRVLRKEAPAVGYTASEAKKQRGTKGTKGIGSDVKHESKKDQQRWLNAHNQVRAIYHAAPLTWNDQITPFAKAEVRQCVWRHSKAGPGENKAAGQFSIENVVSDWTEGPGEKSVYDPHNPTYSHFTQVVWVGTKSISCARYSCQNVRGLRLPQTPVIFWACEYYPPGNIIGQFQQNVNSGKGGIPLSA